jgi:hypothetical protein
MATLRSRFTVTGTWPFPYDMLRYDQCWPATEGDAHNLAHLDELGAAANRCALMMETDMPRGPTPERWRSLGWQVS